MFVSFPRVEIPFFYFSFTSGIIQLQQEGGVWVSTIKTYSSLPFTQVSHYYYWGEDKTRPLRQLRTIAQANIRKQGKTINNFRAEDKFSLAFHTTHGQRKAIQRTRLRTKHSAAGKTILHPRTRSKLTSPPVTMKRRQRKDPCQDPNLHCLTSKEDYHDYISRSCSMWNTPRE